MIRRFSILIVCCVFISACKKENNCLQKSGSEISELRDTNSFFQAIRIKDIVDLDFHTQKQNSIEVIGPRHLIDLVYISVDSNQLHITNKNSCRWLGKYDKSFKVIANMPNIHNLEIYGANNINGLDTIKSSYFRIYLETASGSLNLKINNDILAYSDYSGICKSKIEGYTEHLIMESRSNAQKDFKNLNCRKAQIINHGATHIYIGQVDTLDVIINHVGNVYYKGNPVILQNQTNSTGKLIKY